ncbi:spore coat protein CotH [Cohnella kolymensis]|uniref:Spore coat protein CotH n=1 Tax=Cohnella kolymensis TaxID=1590652 RepID=A0ABR5A7B2_9BACL|nr:CotH kinase family protein [Cohnella kolymensis]KIL36924.1 spore coat protein CotH [Cohnella kolymensis]
MSLPVRTLRISDSTIETMEDNIWNDRYSSAWMKTNGRTSAVSVRYRGGHTREYPKRSYEVVREGQTFHYNAEYDDPSMIRNSLSFAFFPMIGVPAPRTKHVLLYLNDELLGLYLEIEGVEKSFFRRRKIGASSLFYAVNNKADFNRYLPDSNKLKSSLLAGYEHRFGGRQEKLKLTSFISGFHRRQGKELREFLNAKLDVDNYLRWLTGAVLTGNYDGFEQNYALYRNRKNGKLRIIPWDYEGTWGRNCYGKIVDSDLVSVGGYNSLTRKMLELRQFRAQYKSILRSALNGPFTEKKLMPLIEKKIAALAPYIRDDPNRRWSYHEFLGEPEVFRKYIRERRSIVKTELEGRK